MCPVLFFHDNVVLGLHVAPSHEDTVSMTSILSSASQATTLDTWTPYTRTQDTVTPVTQDRNTQEDRKVWATSNKEEKRGED